MSRQEDFIEAGIEYRFKHGTPMAIGGDAFGNMTREMNRTKPFEAGCEYGYQYAVEKVCEWLEEYAANFVALPDEGQQPIGDTNAIYGTKSLLYYLRKEMEESL